MTHSRSEIPVLRLIAVITLMISGLVLLGDTTAIAETFVSYNGKFRIDLPDHWNRADYRTVDYYLSQSTDDQRALQYEALFTPREGGQFAEDAYLLLTVDTIGELSNSQIDSVLTELGETFGEGLKHAPVGDLLTDMTSTAPIYDAETRTVAITTDITEQGDLFKKSLLVMKFYEHGIANFYFYAPSSLYEQSKPIFLNIIASFSTENLEASLPREDVKVADLESRGKQDSKRTLAIAGSAMVILIIVLVTLRSRCRKSRTG